MTDRDLTGTVRFDAVGRRYDLVRRLGRGGFGTVYQARIRTPGGLEQDAAVKLLNPDVDPLAQPVARFRDEAALLSRLHHPAIVTAYDLVVLGDLLALVTEYVDGLDLAALVQQDPMPPGPLVDLVGDIASALSAAWTQAGIVHRDVKPPNVVVGRHGGAKLLDFGIARSVLGEREAQTTAPSMVGSLAYFAPERFDVSRSPDPAWDVFALGCVAFEGLTGARLLELVPPELHRMAQSATAFDGHVAARLARLPDAVRPVLAAMLAHDPVARPTAAAVADRCDELAIPLGGPSLRAWCRQRGWPDQTPQDTRPSELIPAPPSLPSTVVRRRPPVEEAPTEPLKTPPRRRNSQPPPVAHLPPTPPTAPEPVPALATVEPTPAEPISLRNLVLASSWETRILWSAAAFATTTIAVTVIALVALVVGIVSLFQTRETPPPAPTLPVPEVEPVDAEPIADEPAPEAPSGPISVPDRRPATGPTPSAGRARVTFAGMPEGTAYLDEVALGPTNASYEIAVGSHRCGIGLDVVMLADECTIAADTRTVVLPPLVGTVAADPDSAKVPLELRSDDGRRFALGIVPVGAYQVWADFGRGLAVAGSLRVDAGQRRLVKCDKPVRTCVAP